MERCKNIFFGIHTCNGTPNMPNDELLTDEHVAELLAKDAQDCSVKFSTMGMQAYRSDKKYVSPTYTHTRPAT